MVKAIRPRWIRISAAMAMLLGVEYTKFLDIDIFWAWSCLEISVCATSRCSLEVDSLRVMSSSFCFVAQKDLLLASGHSWTWSSVDAFKSNMCCIE